MKTISLFDNDNPIDDPLSGVNLDDLDEMGIDNLRSLFRALQQGDIEGASLELSHIGVSEPYLPHMPKRFDTYKDAIVRNMLVSLREYHDSYDYIHVVCQIDALEKMGVRWPELKSIRRGLDARDEEQSAKGIRETEHGKPDWYMGILKFIRDGNMHGVYNIARINDIKATTHPEFKRLMDSNKWMFIRYLERSLGSEFDGMDQIIYDMLRLRELGIDWPELDTFWDDNKDDVIRILLKTISSNDEDAGFYAWQELEHLRKVGLDWPELAIIKKSALSSMEHERKKIDEDDYDRDRDLEMRYDADYDRGMPDLEVRFHDMLYGSTDVGDLEDILGKLEDMGASRGEVDELIRDDIDYILSWFEDRVERTAKQDAIGFLFTMDDLYDISNPAIAGKIKAALDSSKDAVIRCLLTSIKSGFGYHRDLETIKRANDLLKRMVSWPELATIGKSLDAGKLNESSDLNHASETVQLAAVKRDGYAIKHIEDPSKAVQLAAVKQDDYAIGAIKNPCEEAQLVAVRKGGYLIRYINNPSKAVQLAAVKENGRAIEHIKDPGDAVQIAAVKRSSAAMLHIMNPSDRLWVDDDVKTSVIKTMLYNIKTDYAQDASKTLKYLRKHGCPWPELNAIERSLNAKR